MEVVDTQTAFDNVSQKDISSLYHHHNDDSHWNVEGVKLAARLLEDLIKNKPANAGRR